MYLRVNSDLIVMNAYRLYMSSLLDIFTMCKLCVVSCCMLVECILLCMCVGAGNDTGLYALQVFLCFNLSNISTLFLLCCYII